MDKVHLKNMAFFAHHGALPEETRLGQKFFLDLVLAVDLQQAGQSDDLKDTVCYNTVFNTVESIVKKENFQLLEALAEKIAQTLFERFEKIQSVDLTIRKPEAPIAGIFDYVGIEIHRTR